jgi:predicted RNA-binding Zn-ribbon protein involved in translation (DUF1610 family)
MKPYPIGQIQANNLWYFNPAFYSKITEERIEDKLTAKGVLRELSTIRAFKEFFPTGESILSAILHTRLSKSQSKDCPDCHQPIIGNYRPVPDKPTAYRCSKCGHKIFPLVGTPFEGMRVKIETAWEGLYFLLTSKRGYAAHHFARHTNIRPKSLWRTLNRLREWFALWHNAQSFFPGEEIEIDEAYIMIYDYIKYKGIKLKRGPKSERRYAVITITGRQSLVTKTYPVMEVSGDTLLEALEWAGVNVDHQIKTDEHKIYKCLKRVGFKHVDSCNHKAKKWVTEKGGHTNTLEGFHYRAKSMTERTYEGITRKYIEEYMDEAAFVFSMRRMSPIEIFNELLNVLPALF